MLSYEFGYDSQGRLARRTTTNQSGRQVNEIYSYTADGHLARVRGSSEESQFRYDSNGNLVGMGAVNLEYDVGDRVQRVGGGTQVRHKPSNSSSQYVMEFIDLYELISSPGALRR